MRFSIELAPKDPLWRLEIYASLSEQLGFDTIWMSDHYHNRNVAVALSYVARVTSRIRLGPGVVNPYTTNAYSMAQMAATLSEIAPNRICLGIGSGDAATLETLGIKREKPVEAVENAIKTVRRLLGSTSSSDDPKLDFKAWGNIPIYVGAQGSRMLSLAGRLADGVLINASVPEFVERARRIVENAVEMAGRSRSNISIESVAMVSIDDDREKARKTVKPYVSFLLVGSTPQILDKIGVGNEELERIKALLKARRWLDIQSILRDDLVDYFSISGSPREVRDRLAELCKLQIDGLVLGGPLGPKPRKALLILADILLKNGTS